MVRKFKKKIKKINLSRLLNPLLKGLKNLKFFLKTNVPGTKYGILKSSNLEKFVQLISNYAESLIRSLLVTAQ